MFGSPLNEIVQGLYIGSIAAATEYELLKEHGITHIVTVASEIEASFPDHFRYMVIDIDDYTSSNIIQYFDQTFEFINSAISREYGRVLVHCMAGVSRSATIVIAYLMRKYRMGYEESITYVQSKRSVISPNTAFRQQLKLYQEIGYELNEGNLAYRRFKMDQMDQERQIDGTIRQVTYGPDPSKAGNSSTTVRCKRCRRLLISSENIVTHDPNLRRNFGFSHRFPAGVSARDSSKICTSIFSEPMEWMGDIQRLEGRIDCPKCSCKLGSFNWSGGIAHCLPWLTALVERKMS